MNKKPRSYKRLVLIGILIAAVGGYLGYRHFDNKAKNQPKYEFVTISTSDIEDVVTAQGKLEPKEYVDVGAQVSGQLKSLKVELGQQVKMGDQIAEIDPKLYLTQVSADEARLKTLQAQRDQQKAQLQLANLILKRNQKLIKEKAVSQQVLEEAQTSQKVAEAELKSLDAQIEESQSTLDGNKAKLEFTQIFAPMNGTVVVQTAREGETLNANQTTPTIVQIANLDIMTVRAQVAEADINKLKVDMPVYFTTLGSNGRKWEGVIRQILPTPETINDVVLFNVLVDAKNEDRQLMTDMSTQMFFVLGRSEKAVLVPATALVKRLPAQDNENGLAYMVRVSKNGVLQEQTIHIGILTRSFAEVKDGLSDGDKVALAIVTTNDKDAAQKMKMPRL